MRVKPKRMVEEARIKRRCWRWVEDEDAPSEVGLFMYRKDDLCKENVLQGLLGKL